MSTLTGLQHFSRLACDSADIDEIKRYGLSHVTTNPTLIRSAAQTLKYQRLVKSTYEETVFAFGDEILGLIMGELSVQLDPRISDDFEETCKRARIWWKHFQSDRVLIKIPATEAGIKAMRLLELEGIACNMTLVFSLSQALECADATCIAPYVGRVSDWHGDEGRGARFVKAIHKTFQEQKIATKIMGASFRSVKQILSLAGIDFLTIAPKYLLELQTSFETVIPMDSRDALAPEEGVIQKCSEGIELFKKDVHFFS